MELNRKEFLNVLKRALPGVETGNVILDGADTFIFDDGFVHSYNDNISVSIPLALTNKSGEPISGAIKAKDFFDLVNRYTGDTLKLIPKADVWIVKSKNATAELTLLESSIITRIKNIFPKKIKWEPVPDGFIEGLEVCSFSSNKAICSGIFVSDNTMVSTDAIRLAFHKMSSPVAKPFWITDIAAQELRKLDNVKNYYISDSWVHFITENKSIFSCKRLMQDTYPFDKIQNLLKTHGKEKGDLSNELPKTILDAIGRASALSQNVESYNTIRLTFMPDGVEVFSQRPSGKYSEMISWEKPFKKLDPISIQVDYSMIEIAIKYSNAFHIKQVVERGLEKKRIVFTNPHGMQIVSTF